MTSYYAHDTALVESESIGAGTLIWAFAHIMPGAVIGSDCKIGDHAFVESGAIIGDRVTVKNNTLIWHGVRIEDEVFVGPGVVFTNEQAPRTWNQTGPDDWGTTLVQRGATIGANATIVSGVRLGVECMVGAGSVVTSDVSSHALIVGNPGRAVGWVCHCGQRLNGDLDCPVCGKSYAIGPGGLTAKAS